MAFQKSATDEHCCDTDKIKLMKRILEIATLLHDLSELTVTSGGQTGVDRAALDVALELGIPCEGWCPRGRRAEDGPIADRYPLQETSSAHYPVRTRWNVRDA